MFKTVEFFQLVNTIRKQNLKSAKFEKLFCLSYIMLRIQKEEGKQCRSRGAVTSGSTLFVNKMFTFLALQIMSRALSITDRTIYVGRN